MKDMLNKMKNLELSSSNELILSVITAFIVIKIIYMNIKPVLVAIQGLLM